MTEQNGKGLLTAELIRQAEDRVVERVEIPEWGGHVFVRSITAAERDALEDSMFEGRGRNRQLVLRNVRARMAIMAACDEQGNRIFQNADLDWLQSKNGKAVDRIYDVASTLAGITDADFDELVGNSSAGTPGDSDSG